MSENAKPRQARQILDVLGDPVFVEAAEVLQSIATNPREREIYEARLKLRRDEESRIEAAEERGEARGEARGREEGAAKGSLAGKIQLLQELLGERQMALAELMVEPEYKLAMMLTELQERLRTRE